MKKKIHLSKAEASVKHRGLVSNNVWVKSKVLKAKTI